MKKTITVVVILLLATLLSSCAGSQQTTGVNVSHDGFYIDENVRATIDVNRKKNTVLISIENVGEKVVQLEMQKSSYKGMLLIDSMDIENKNATAMPATLLQPSGMFRKIMSLKDSLIFTKGSLYKVYDWTKTASIKDFIFVYSINGEEKHILF